MMAFSTLSSEEKRFSVMVPLRRLRILAWTNPRRLPGVRWLTLKTVYSSLLYLITMPGRICVADIMNSSKCGLGVTRVSSIAGGSACLCARFSRLERKNLFADRIEIDTPVLHVADVAEVTG